MTDLKKIKVFVTYAWGDEQHNLQVLGLTDHLRKKGFEAYNDKLLCQDETSIDLLRMMYQRIFEADKVIVILTDEYVKKADAYEGGVGIEYQVITKDIITRPKKYILAAFEGYRETLLPFAMKKREMLSLTDPEAMDQLYRKLLDKPKYEAAEVAPATPVLESVQIPEFTFKAKPAVDVTMKKVHDDYAANVWDVSAAQAVLQAAVAANDPEEVKAVIRDNSFLLFDIYERKMGALPIFHEVAFGSHTADFTWLDDASNGPRWFLLKVGAPDLLVFDAGGKINPLLLEAIEEVKAWANYFELQPAEKKRLFGYVSSFRFRLIIGNAEQWQTEAAQRWRMQHNNTSFVEVRSYNTFELSLAEIADKPTDFYRFNRFHKTSGPHDLETFWKSYGYMDDYRKWQ
jgi:hypothetical protein